MLTIYVMLSTVTKDFDSREINRENCLLPPTYKLAGFRACPAPSPILPTLSIIIIPSPPSSLCLLLDHVISDFLGGLFSLVDLSLGLLLSMSGAHIQSFIH